jgi:predicted nucleotidyltransferase
VENLLENLLSYIVLNQEEISTLNYREFITYIVKTYPQKTFLFKDNQMYRLKNKYINPPLT